MVWILDNMKSCCGCLIYKCLLILFNSKNIETYEISWCYLYDSGFYLDSY
jgi:hypothetical protein